ncbi:MULTISPECIES: DegT/DnrJ/EryC1/StrS family aminotransferase [unclassified Prochlorococcus]|uniref:DegT/DnrJ/EryC1/StrS family aminotransferase n=1 Tax=unclassified Prochlorococcus TaxID=2627481 RepID=UPI0005337616|nr:MULTISPECIES: aminotransferase class I/II-fold pyridoxal phosphate-dependent enzyme [unclassified Prochlorococcus]KGG16339.1 NDP-hexose 3,4-dehydratase [Prochlorococcus sp. MIT 0603]KGG17927.1 NDP-hexose 3,4-dehydratase [Prochlorococcus sp. MIT 0602]
MDQKISYAKTVYGKEEIDAVVKCLNESTQMGKYSRKFESKIADLFRKRYGLYVNSGSSALYLAIEACEFKEGSEVITPALTFSTTVGCLVKNNLVPVFTDIKENTYLIDTSQIEDLINDKTVAILAPNLLGNVCQWDLIRKIADKFGLVLIEDSADTLGATINNGESTGVYTDISITSFYGSHIINCAGNGGALTLNDSKIMKTAKLLRSWGRSSSLYDENSESIENRFNTCLDGIDYDAKFVFERVGYNLEGNELGAAFGLKQLNKLKENIKLRQNNFIKQFKYFSQYSDLFTNPEETKGANTAWLAYPIIINKGAPFTRKQFQIYLEERGIQTRVVFTGNILRQPMSKSFYKKVTAMGLEKSDNVMQRGVLLPVHHGMTDKMFDKLHNTIDGFIALHR